MTAALLALDAQLADGLTFALAVSRWGIGGESNGAAAALYGSGGIETVLAVKLAGALALALLAWRLSPRRWALLPALVGIVGAVTNLWALLPG